MNTFSRLFAGVAVLLVLGGCATSRSELDVALPAATPVQATGDKTVFISTPIDRREFQVKPSSPDIPSLDPNKAQSDEITQRAIGRKRNAYGMALGDILLKEGVTVSALTSDSIAQAYSEHGYRVLSSAEEATTNTVMVEPTITQFWSWMNPGFWAITLSSEIETDLTVKSTEQDETIHVAVKAADNFQTGMESNWVAVIQEALRLYVDDLKTKIK